jgi:cation diffusion facilitator CzcD-associated flavoprotein CzcO
VKDSPENRKESEAGRAQMAEKLNHDLDLCTKLIPTWGLGCRRITPAEGYLESFSKPNVQLVFGSVTQATEDSVMTADGQSFKVDVIVCATGFDVSWKPQWRMIGKNGVDLNQEWTIYPKSYLSLAAAEMPNHFIFLGPNAVVTHGSLIESINWTADYILKWLHKASTEDIKSITPKTAAINEFIEKCNEIHQTLVWTDSCTSWFKRNTLNGRVTAGFGGSALLFRKLIEEIRAEDYEIVYWHANRWSFLGNGFTEYEMHPKNDLSWYIKH